MLARTTIAIAFQRMIDRSRRSSAGSPGSLASRVERDRVDVRRVERRDRPSARVLGALDDPPQDLTCAVRAVVRDHRVERLEPLSVSAASTSAPAPLEPGLSTRSTIVCDGTRVPSADADLVFAGPLALAERVRAKEIQPRELVEACLRRIEALDPRLNAFRVTLPEEALAAADTVPTDGPLAGRPDRDQGLHAARRAADDVRLAHATARRRRRTPKPSDDCAPPGRSRLGSPTSPS